MRTSPSWSCPDIRPSEFPRWSEATIGPALILEWQTRTCPRMAVEELDRIAIGLFGMPAPAAAGAGLLGVLDAVWPIASIIVMSVWSYRLASNSSPPVAGTPGPARRQSVMSMRSPCRDSLT